MDLLVDPMEDEQLGDSVALSIRGLKQPDLCIQCHIILPALCINLQSIVLVQIKGNSVL